MIYCNKPMRGNGYCGEPEDDYDGTRIVNLCPECEARNAMKKEQEEVFEMTEILARELAEVF